MMERLLDITGRVLHRKEERANQKGGTIIETKNLAKGTYIVRLSNNTGVIGTHKLIKE